MIPDGDLQQIRELRTMYNNVLELKYGLISISIEQAFNPY